MPPACKARAETPTGGPRKTRGLREGEPSCRKARRRSAGAGSSSCSAARPPASALVSLAGCGGGGGDQPSDEGEGGEGAASGLSDTITYSLTADPRALDPAYFDDGESAVVSCNIYEGLYQYGRTDASVLPCLATDLPEISDDGLEYTIKLREGIKFPRRRRVQRRGREDLHRAPAGTQPQLRHALRLVRVRRGGGRKRRGQRGGRSMPPR